MTGYRPACPLCGRHETRFHAEAHDIEYCTSDESWIWHACDPCGVLFIDPMPVDRLGTIYPANYYSYGAGEAGGKASTVQKIKEALDRRRFKSLLSTVRGNQLSVLDIGGGSGWLLDMVRDADPRVTQTTVVDLDAGAAGLARAKGHTFVQGRIEDAALDGTFDFILMLNLIEHVADPRAMLAKVRRLLKPGGQLFIKTPNYASLDARLFRHRSWAGFHTPRHFVLFQRRSLETLARECGLEPVSFSYTQGAPFWSVSLLEELRRLGLVRITAERPAVTHPLIPALQAASAAFDFLRRPFAPLSQMELVLKPAE
ncbi:methyltransferase [Novosphingobium fuchskuhlense]|uniref:Methyltransferase n=2 Tax=Novosphingobium fuchskuhlense TaxID=1117702 RepID=A0A117UW36_9SPHN|nr:methyltransferase [Novosphingobium fuchskuhlense]